MFSSIMAKISYNWWKGARQVVDLFLNVSLNNYPSNDIYVNKLSRLVFLLQPAENSPFSMQTLRAGNRRRLIFTFPLH